MKKKLRIAACILLFFISVFFMVLGVIKGCRTKYGDELHDPLLPRDYIFAVRAYNGVYDKYGSDFYLKDFTYTGDEYGYMWTGTFRHKKLKFDMLTYFYPAAHDDTQLVFYDEAQFAYVDKLLRDEMFEKIKELYEKAPNIDYSIVVRDKNSNRWNDDLEEGMQPFDGKFLNYEEFKNKLQSEENDLYINIDINFIYPVKEYSKSEQNQIIISSYKFIKYLQEKKFTPVNLKINFAYNQINSSDSSYIALYGNSIYDIKKPQDILKYHYK